MRTAIAIAMILAPTAVVYAQEETRSPAQLMIDLETALPRRAPAQNEQVRLSHTIDWDKAIDSVGRILAQASGTFVEPHALFVLGNNLYAANQVDQAKVTFEDLKARFPDHPLCTKIKDTATSRSLVDQALEDCATELAFRARHPVKTLPVPELDPESTTTLHLSLGDVKIQFYKNAAPEHRANFMKLAKAGFFDRTRAHRIMPGEFVQMGDPNSRERDPNQWGKGDPGYVLPQEYSRITHKRGTLTALRGAGAPSSHGSQFQILLQDRPTFDFVQTPFAEVVEGITIIDNLSRQSPNQYQAPVTDCFLNGVTTPGK